MSDVSNSSYLTKKWSPIITFVFATSQLAIQKEEVLVG
jgi:hypothetical protein